MDGESQHSGRASVCQWRYCSHPATRRGIGELAPRCDCGHRDAGHCCAQTGDPQHPDSVLCRERYSRTRLRGQLGSSRREHHRLFVRRLPHDRQMAGDNEGGHPWREADDAHVQSGDRAILPVFLREFGAAGSPLAAEVSVSPVRNEAEIETAATAFAREPGGGLIAAPDPFINTHRAFIISSAHRHRLADALRISAACQGRRADGLWARLGRDCPAVSV